MGLNEKENYILELIAEGLTSEEIAEKLEITSRNVQTYKKHMLNKTKTRNMASMVAFGFKYGLLKL
ncbi:MULTISPECIES: helix-turn-helix transcriptional regulator [Pedobacter]|uniref:helix-turn-helix transcriptional regulator n=1 Tax=Pedobacter TaxID=84567 RepID=UPI000649FAA0|nr:MULTISPECIES: helix-turn-helix transcriptional regulator [Pedobacter]KLT67139.1 hypothetical protein AB669_03595 [Pedobacter sp. BMA]